MRLFTLFLLALLYRPLSAQILTQTTAELTPSEAYSNVQSVTLHDDENTTVYLIFIKKAVRKHLHQYHTEVITVLGGRGRMLLGGEYFNIKKGDHIIVPPNTPHAVVTTSMAPLKVLSVQTPQFLGQDRMLLQDERSEEEIKAEVSKRKKNKKDKKRKKKKKVNDIPEFEGEFD
jgi:mannose-6-phosphate isomerase-like protein (cupin superfamily)